LDSTVGISLFGSSGERNQHGRIVEFTLGVTGDRTQTRIVDGGSGYMVQSGYRIDLAVASTETINVSAYGYDIGASTATEVRFAALPGQNYSVFAANGSTASRVINAATGAAISHERHYAQSDGDDVVTIAAAGRVLIGASAGNDQITLSGGQPSEWAGSIVQLGDGDDTIIFEFTAAVSSEIAIQGGAGFDSLYTSANYVLAWGASIEQLSAANAASTTGFTLYGNEIGQQINGAAGADFLDGRGGEDIFAGRGGSDTYIVNSAGDQIIEAVGGGNDQVIADAHYILNAGAEVELLRARTYAATTALNLTGNEFAQTIYGNAGINVLTGGGGNDTLVGLGGNDTLIGGLGDDVAQFSGLRSSYRIVTQNGSVSVIDDLVSVDGDDGTDMVVSVERLQFNDGETVNIVSPIILDLEGDGIELLSAAESHSLYDLDGDGV
ncbi:MAG: hypothetical protein ACRC2U_03550, partial [Aeromonas sp.]